MIEIKNDKLAVPVVLFAGILWSFGPLVVRYMDQPELVPWQYIFGRGLTIFIILVTTVIIWLTFKSKGFEKFSFIMIIGGSFGNIFDRIFYSAVPDFIDIHINNFHWFIFNVADIFITLGIICLISIEILGNKKFKNENY